MVLVKQVWFSGRRSRVMWKGTGLSIAGVGRGKQKVPGVTVVISLLSGWKFTSAGRIFQGRETGRPHCG
jgi:hypothetical protein